MDRKGFLRNAMMALAVSLLPKTLQPSLGKLVEDREIIGNTGLFVAIRRGAGEIHYYHNGKFTMVDINENFNNS